VTGERKCLNGPNGVLCFEGKKIEKLKINKCNKIINNNYNKITK